MTLSGSLRSPAPPKGESPSQALPRQLSRRESQAVKADAKALGVIRKLPAVLLPLPLGEVAATKGSSRRGRKHPRSAGEGAGRLPERVLKPLAVDGFPQGSCKTAPVWGIV